jgi:hypothetical protein
MQHHLDVIVAILTGDRRGSAGVKIGQPYRHRHLNALTAT